MEYLKGKVKDLSMVPGEHAKFINSVKEIMSIEELKAWTGPNKKFFIKLNDLTANSIINL